MSEPVFKLVLCWKSKIAGTTSKCATEKWVAISENGKVLAFGRSEKEATENAITVVGKPTEEEEQNYI